MHSIINKIKILKLISIIILLTFTTGNTYKIDTILSTINRDTSINTIPEINKITSKLSIDENILNTLSNYPALKELVKEAHIKIPTENGFIPQGMTLINSYYFITGYYDSNINSRCYVIDAIGDIINIIDLDTTSHVGSISYDKKRDILWIPDNNGILNAYNYSDFFNKNHVKATHEFIHVSLDLPDFQNTSRNLIAYLCVDEDYVYIGNFFINQNCTIKKYKIETNDQKIELKLINKFTVPKRTQSINFFEKDNKKYMLLSQSYNRKNPSYLYAYEYDENKKIYNNTEIKKIKIPPMLEQISIANKQIYLLFESNAQKYWNCPEKIEFILGIDLFL